MVQTRMTTVMLGSPFRAKKQFQCCDALCWQTLHVLGADAHAGEAWRHTTPACWPPVQSCFGGRPFGLIPRSNTRLGVDFEWGLPELRRIRLGTRKYLANVEIGVGQIWTSMGRFRLFPHEAGRARELSNASKFRKFGPDVHQTCLQFWPKPSKIVADFGKLGPKLAELGPIRR